MKKPVLFILPSNGFNEHEYRVIRESLTRRGLPFFISAEKQAPCKGSSGLKVQPDVIFMNIHPVNFQGVILCGGSGSTEYWANPVLHNILRTFHKTGKPVGAICASAVTLAKAGIAEGKKITCYPENKKAISGSGAEYVEEPFIVSNNIVTGKDPASAAAFSDAFLRLLVNE